MTAVFKVVSDDRLDANPEMVGMSSSSLLQLNNMNKKARSKVGIARA